ncbi:MAG: hypothetical protein ACOCVF_01390 [bacterium]
MPRIRVINRGQNSDLIGGNFQNIASNTLFSFGGFKVETNFTGRRFTDYRNRLDSFAKPITLENLNVNIEESERIFKFTNNVNLNFDRSDLKNYARFGSTSEILRVSVQNIISSYPASLFASRAIAVGGNLTIVNYSYDQINDVTTFQAPAIFLVNNFGLVYNQGNTGKPNNNTLKNLNLSFSDYVVYRSSFPDDNSHEVMGFTGDSVSNPFITIKAKGNPFPELSGGTTQGSINFHVKPKPIIFNKFKDNLSRLERYLILDRSTGQQSFTTVIKEPQINEAGEIRTIEREVKFPTSDGYNVDVEGSRYDRFLSDLSRIGNAYDNIKTDLIIRLLTPSSLRKYDQTEQQKMDKLLKIYGREFDEQKQLIDALTNVYKVTYDKIDNIPDQIVKNFARTLGWNPFTIVDEETLATEFFTTVEKKDDDLSPAEIDIELWRRILINTNYFWKAKGTRHGIKALFQLIGIPEPFINITEYVYTVDGKINPDDVTVTLNDLPSASLPYNSQGYPIAPRETNDFYFQISGNTDSGQAYLDVFRQVGFNLSKTIDNKKSWIATGNTERIHPSTPNYFQEDSKLIINTKEIDITLDIARGIEYDVYCYNKEVDFPITNTGVTKPNFYINIPFEYGFSADTFTIPEDPKDGVIQLNFNGITLTSGGTGSGDYVRIGTREVKLNSGVAQTYSSGNKDTITLTYMYDRLGQTGVTNIYYVVQAPVVKPDGTEIDLGVEPKGDIQLVVDGKSLSKGTSLFTGDFIINPSDRTKIIIQNSALVTYLQTMPIVRVWYLEETGISNAEKRSEVHRVDSLSSSKIFFDTITQRYVYVMDFEAQEINSIKMTLNGITLQNQTDVVLNPTNKRQVYIRSNINYGDVIGVYYVVGDTSFTPPILPPDPTFPDITEMSFLEYLELIRRRLINVKNRKTIPNIGGYPTVLKIYEEYIRRSFLDDNNPLKSNGYTYENLFAFINRYNAFFNRFVNVMLPATIILRKGGISTRNTSFTRQKFVYKRGVNFDEELQYLGNDGSEFVKRIPQIKREWTGEQVCEFIPDPCSSFDLFDINVVDPCNDLFIDNVTVINGTTTTTAAPTCDLSDPEFTITNAKKGSANGRIEFDSISGDNGNLTWSVGGSSFKDVSLLYENLPVGNYNIIVKDDIISNCEVNENRIVYDNLVTGFYKGTNLPSTNVFTNFGTNIPTTWKIDSINDLFTLWFDTGTYQNALDAQGLTYEFPIIIALNTSVSSGTFRFKVVGSSGFSSSISNSSVFQTSRVIVNSLSVGSTSAYIRLQLDLTSGSLGDLEISMSDGNTDPNNTGRFREQITTSGNGLQSYITNKNRVIVAEFERNTNSNNTGGNNNNIEEEFEI